MDVTSVSAKGVISAIERASAATGIDFDFLVKTAQRESSLDPTAKASTSSAAGLFQFIEQTWLGAVKAYGARHGLGDFAASITRDGAGGLSVGDDVRRTEILDLRFDPKAAAAMAGELARENKAVLERTLGRAASAVDLYAAHFLGARGASRLLSSEPSTPAADILPAAARANKHVFYDGLRPRSAGQVIAAIEKSIGVETPSSLPIANRHEPLSSTSPGEQRYRPFAPRSSGNVHTDLTIEKRYSDFLSLRPGEELAFQFLYDLDPLESIEREKHALRYGDLRP